MRTLPTPMLILGAEGMLGQDLGRVFDASTTVMWDRAQLDITNHTAVVRALNELKPAIILNAAAYNAVDAAETEDGFATALLLNTEAPKRLAEWCENNNVLFVHYSSDYVFDGTSREGYTEETNPHPISQYGESKLRGEQAVLNAGGRGYVIRTCKLFGLQGASTQSKKSFVDTMLELSKTKKQIDVVDAEFASPTYTHDLAAQTSVLIQGALDGSIAPGVFHVTNSGACTWYGFAREIFRQAGIEVVVRPISPDQYPRPAKRPQYSVLLNTKLPTLRSWQEALGVYLQERKQQ